MKIRTAFVSNSSSSSFIVQNYSPLSVEKEMFDIFMKHTTLPPKEAKSFFKEWFKVLPYSDTMSRRERKTFERMWHDYTWTGVEDGHFPKGRGTVVVEVEGMPPNGFEEDAYSFREECEEHFKNSIPWRRLS